MHLKKIEIFGFKSFAGRVVLNFHPGITGIVGPNGCGKSNIADAFRWVMGEQSSKSLRGSKREDVIFAGTSLRKPLNIAEVTLIFTDVNGAFPTEYEEVAITRRLHRSGESEYLINRQPARLKDIQGFFLDSGIGKSALSIFEQGKIDQVINLTPLERRSIFEEAAGITRVLMSKKEALNKLEPTNQNIARLRDVFQEVAKQMAVSELQAEQAKRYRGFQTELEEMEQALLVAKWQAANQKCQQYQLKVDEAHDKLAGFQSQNEDWKKNLEESKKVLAEEEKKLRHFSEELYKTRSTKEIQKRENSVANERLKESIEREKSLVSEIEELQERTETLREEISENEKQQKILQAEFNEVEKRVRAESENVLQIENELNKLRDKSQKAQQERLRHLQIESQAQSDLKQTQLQISHCSEREEQIRLRLNTNQQHVNELQKLADEKKMQLEAVIEELNQKKAEIERREHHLSLIDQELGQSKKELDQLQRQITEDKARQKVLLKLRDEMEGFSAASKQLLKESQNRDSHLFGKIKGLYELLPAVEGQEVALGTALRYYTQTLVVQTQEDYREVIAFAAQKNLKDFSILCMDMIDYEKNDIKSTSDNIKPLLQFGGHDRLAHHLMKKLFLAKGVDEAFEFSKANPQAEIWTEDGAWIDHHRVIFYPTQGEGNVFLREAELHKLEKEIADQEKMLMRLERNFKDLNERKAALKHECTEFDKIIRRDEMKHVEFNFALQKAYADQEKAKLQVHQLEEEASKINQQYKRLNEALEEIIKRHEAATQQAAQAQQLCVNSDAELEQRSGIFKSKQRELRELEANYQQLSGQNQKFVYAINLLENRLKETRLQQEKQQHEIQMCKRLQKQFGEQSKQFSLSLESIDQQLEELTKQCREMDEELEQKRQSVSNIDKSGDQLRQRIKEIENIGYQAGIQLAQAGSTRQTIEDEFRHKYQKELSEAIAAGVSLSISLDQAEKKCRSLKQQIEAIGNVNLAAIDEFAQHQERHAYLAKQLDDLAVTQQELMKIISQLEVDCRKLFKTTFESIRLNFIKNFRILFNGGEADLQLTESDEILEAGVEIIAKPPGKQMRSISLLSGGEKCLTAMALLFAIFEVRPAPFCILDEIDAPLDDSNIERFANVVKQFIDRCQFIIITHNKRTMSVADLLFGVSMEEKGVSKILTLQFSKESEAQPSMV